jgi:hypothetical protein
MHANSATGLGCMVLHGMGLHTLGCCQIKQINQADTGTLVVINGICLQPKTWLLPLSACGAIASSRHP